MQNKTIHKNTAPVLHVDERVSLEEQIAHRAQELWEHRSREHGSNFSDWFRAEREVNEWHQRRLRGQRARQEKQH